MPPWGGSNQAACQVKAAWVLRFGAGGGTSLAQMLRERGDNEDPNSTEWLLGGQVNSWLSLRVQALRDLEEREIIRWSGVEMAMFEGDPSSNVPHRFEHPRVSCLQLLVLHAHLEDEAHALRLRTWQDDVKFWLDATLVARADLDPSGPADESDGFFRHRDDLGLPTGRVVRVATSLRDDRILDVDLTVAGRRGHETLIICAGELLEAPDGSLRACAADESVLVFRSREDLHSIPWLGDDAGYRYPG